MAALAIPIVVLGSLYILSEQEKKRENFIEEVEKSQNEENEEQFMNGNSSRSRNIQENFSNYNTRKLDDFESQNLNLVNSYNNSNQHTDKYFIKESSNFLTQEKDLNKVNLMSGQQVDTNSFKHNNMQPFFGAKIRGATSDLNNTESILDSKQGYGSQLNSKVEQAPLFKPDEHTNFQHGTPNNSDFFQSRVNESMKMSNVTLWEQQRVGPGLNMGYGSQNEKGFNSGGTEGSNGFNAGMMSRETWMPKSVDDLRVENNPKQTFDLNGHQGPAINLIKSAGPNDKIGKVEKHLPDKSYESGPSKWFTTTGVEQAPPIRSTQVIPMENRISTTQEYYGGGSNTQNGQATYNDLNYEESKRQNLAGLPISNASASNRNNAGPNDYGQMSYKILPNNRTTDGDTMNVGSIYGAAKSVVAPLLDIFKTTRKENVLGNLRQTGNVNGLTPTGHLFNENDKTKTTNREMFTDKINMNYVNVQPQNHGGDAYQVTDHQPIQNQRATTNQEYIGSGSSQGQGLRTYNAAYSQQNNVNKTYESRANQGNMSLFNNSNNVYVTKNENIFANSRSNVINGGPSIIPSAQFMGEVNGIQTYDQTYNNSRMDESLLSAFKNNPYTKSLTSVA